MPLEFRTKRNFEPHETLLLKQLTEDQVSFKQMTSILKDRTENSLRTKYRKLTSTKR